MESLPAVPAADKTCVLKNLQKRQIARILGGKMKGKRSTSGYG